MQEQEMEYAGFWIRTWATIIDNILISMITTPLLLAIYGPGYYKSDNPNSIDDPVYYITTWVIPAIAVIAFWITKQATPGKMAISAKIVDARSGNAPNTGQLIGRYFGYFLSALPLGLGFFWVAFDGKKQGWHDKLAGTVVVLHRQQNADVSRYHVAMNTPQNEAIKTPQTVAKKTSPGKLIATLGCGVLFLAMAVGGVRWLGQFAGPSKEALEAARELGRREGAHLDEARCMAAAIERRRQDSQNSSAPAPDNIARLYGCLVNSQVSTDFCDDVPPRENPFQTAFWVKSHCNNTPSFLDPSCDQMFKTVADYCSSPKRRAKLKCPAARV